MVIGIEANHANKKDRTGVEEYCYQIIQSLKKQIPPTERVVLYSNGPLQGDLANLPSNWKVKILKWPFGKLWSQIRLSLELLFHKPDIFFSPGQLIPFFCPKRTVTMIHDSAFLVYPGAYKFLGRQYLKWMNKRIIKISSKILTSSEFNKKELVKFYGANVGKKVVVVPLAFGDLPNPPDFDLKNLGITKPFILSIGRLETKKNTKHLIQVFSVVKQRADVQLVLVGKPGVGYKQIINEIKHCPYREDIRPLGYIEKSHITGLLKKAAVFVFPSLYEGFGLPVLEAMKVGAPVIASDIEALHEVGGNAIAYSDPLDVKTLSETIIQIVSDTGEQIKYSHQGRERALQFSWEKAGVATWEAIAN